MSFIFISFLILFFCSSVVHCTSENSTTQSLDVSLQVLAFKSLGRHHPHTQTGALYKAILPKNMSGMEASILRIRSRRLWNKGVNFSYIHIPSRTIPVPPARRLAIIYQDLGNWSSQYYAVPGYTLLTSVVGFMVYDVTDIKLRNITNLQIRTMGKPISIHFHTANISDYHNLGRIKCVTFAANGTFLLSEMSTAKMCLSQGQGHFSLVAPVEVKKRQNRFWVMGLVLGGFGLLLVGCVGIVSVKLMRTKKIQVMERKTDEDGVLGTRWIDQTKMPHATVTRTRPAIGDVLGTGLP